jgi:hypothetical protein
MTAQLAPRWFGFEMEKGSTIEVEADTIAEAITQAESATGRLVVRGRCLDDYDDSTGRADLGLAAMFAEIRATAES